MGDARVVVPVPSRHPDVRARVEALAADGRVRTYPHPPADAREWTARTAGAAAVLHFFDDGSVPTEALVAAAPARVVVAGPAAGCLDVATLRARGVEVQDTPGTAVRAVAEHAVGLMLRAARLPGPHPQDGPVAGLELWGARLGLVGLGRVGTAVAGVARALGMRVQVTSRHLRPERAERLGVECVALPRLMSTSDVVSVHLRDVPATTGLVDRSALHFLRPDTVFVNTSRARVVDMGELRRMVGAGELWRVALDVLDVEPLPGHDILNNHPSVIVTPHIAWLTRRTVERMMDAALSHLDLVRSEGRVNVGVRAGD